MTATALPRFGAQLSERELAVINGYARGRGTAGVAADLKMSIDTVKRDAFSLYVKLGAQNRAHAVALAGEAGLITSPVGKLASAAGVDQPRGSAAVTIPAPLYDQLLAVTRSVADGRPMPRQVAQRTLLSAKAHARDPRRVAGSPS